MRDSVTTEWTLVCNRDGTPAIKRSVTTVDSDGEPELVAVSMETWTKAWKLAELANWKTVRPACTELDTLASVRMSVAQQGTTQAVDCSGELSLEWTAIRALLESEAETAIAEAHRPRTLTPEEAVKRRDSFMSKDQCGVTPDRTGAYIVLTEDDGTGYTETTLTAVGAAKRVDLTSRTNIDADEAGYMREQAVLAEKLDALATTQKLAPCTSEDARVTATIDGKKLVVVEHGSQRTRTVKLASAGMDVQSVFGAGDASIVVVALGDEDTNVQYAHWVSF